MSQTFFVKKEEDREVKKMQFLYVDVTLRAFEKVNLYISSTFNQLTSLHIFMVCEVSKMSLLTYFMAAKNAFRHKAGITSHSLKRSLLFVIYWAKNVSFIIKTIPLNFHNFTSWTVLLVIPGVFLVMFSR